MVRHNDMSSKIFNSMTNNIELTQTIQDGNKPPMKTSTIKNTILLCLLFLLLAFQWHLSYQATKKTNNIDSGNGNKLSLSKKSSFKQELEDFKLIDTTKMLKHRPIPMSNLNGICSIPPGQGEEGPAGIKGLHKISNYLQQQRQRRQSTYRIYNNNVTLSSGPSDINNLRLLCIVYTHSNHHDIIQAIAETYGAQCDGFLAASNLTNTSIGAVKIDHPGPESYDFMWQKVRAIWKFVHDAYFHNYDLFHIGGDDMYVIPDNLRTVAQHYWTREQDNAPTFPGTKNVKRTVMLYLGASIPNPKNPGRRFCGGGAGYTLNRFALKLLVQKLFHHESCNGIHPASNEDVRIGSCFDIVGIKCFDTNDEMDEMRYHHLDVQYHAAYKPDRPALWHWETLYHLHNITGNQSLLGQISKSTISFHLAKGVTRSIANDHGIRRYHAILYKYCGIEFDKQVAVAANASKEYQMQLRKAWEQLPKTL